MKKIVLAVLIAIIAGIIFFIWIKTSNFSGKVVEVIEGENFSISKIIFYGEDGKEIYALFYRPNRDNFDVVIVLPAGAGTKESRGFYGEMLAEIGYGALILDQRGIGETDGNIPSLEEDFYQNFINGKESFQILTAKDVVKAIDYLNSLKEVNEVGVLGESMGGRNAIIAAGLDNRIKTAIIISSAGYSASFSDARLNEFFSYINPDSYVIRIGPRRILMLHSINDNVVLISDARRTFSLAKEPKNFVEFNDLKCIHGYCKLMYNAIKDELEFSFKED